MAEQKPYTYVGGGYQSAHQVEAQKPKPPQALDPRYTTLVDYAKDQRDQDLGAGKDFFSKYFGEGNADMAEIIKARKAAAYGTDPTYALQRAQGVNSINSQMQTAMRGLGSRLSASGIRGGAAAAMGAPLAREALQARQGFETNMAVNEQKRKDAALQSLESTLTGERGGLLGGMFGFAGLGAQDRGNALQSILGQDYIKSAQQGLDAASQKPEPSFMERLKSDPTKTLYNAYKDKIPGPQVVKEIVSAATGGFGNTLAHPESWGSGARSWTSGRF